MNIWHDIDKNKVSPEEFITCIEITKGSKTKYEIDKELGMIVLDRVLYTSHIIPQTMVLFQEHMHLMMIHLMSLFYAVKT